MHHEAVVDASLGPCVLVELKHHGEMLVSACDTRVGVDRVDREHRPRSEPGSDVRVGGFACRPVAPASQPGIEVKQVYVRFGATTLCCGTNSGKHLPVRPEHQPDGRFDCGVVRERLGWLTEIGPMRPSRSAVEITRPDRPRKANALAATLQSAESSEGAGAEGDSDEPNVTETIGFETVDRDSLLASTVRRNAPHTVAGKAPRDRTGRWTCLGGIPRSIPVCPMLFEDRVLGTLELAHTDFGSTFGKNDERTLTCSRATSLPTSATCLRHHSPWYACSLNSLPRGCS